MSPNPNKTSALGAIIILVTACSTSISAQTPAVVNGFTAKPDLIPETKETALKKKSVPLAEGTDPTSGPAAASEVSPRTQDSDLVWVNANTKVAAGDEGREAIRKAPPASRKAPPVSPQTASSDEWQFQVSPYFWLASLHGTGGVGNRTAQVDESFSDIFHSLDFALMGLFEARKGKLFVLTDLEYVAVSDDKATPGPLFSNVNAKFKTFIFDPEVGYRVYYDPDKGASVDILVGSGCRRTIRRTLQSPGRIRSKRRSTAITPVPLSYTSMCVIQRPVTFQRTSRSTVISSGCCVRQ